MSYSQDPRGKVAPIPEQGKSNAVLHLDSWHERARRHMQDYEASMAKQLQARRINQARSALIDSPLSMKGPTHIAEPDPAPEIDGWPELPSEFLTDLAQLLNRYSIDNRLSTPDFILARYIENNLAALAAAQHSTEAWANGDNE